jgi:bifunctional DNA-binding transcriptional regulator/antitoxin component of YhaV-PrlF toxin-antitoxin module
VQHVGSPVPDVAGRGLLVLPADLRRRHRLDEPGAQLEIVERDHGIIELRPHTAVPAAQDWFWTERWQAMERGVDERVSGGEVTTHETGDDFLGHLGRLETDT